MQAIAVVGFADAGRQEALIEATQLGRDACGHLK